MNDSFGDRIKAAANITDGNSTGDKIKAIANIFWYASIVIVIAVTIAMCFIVDDMFYRMGGGLCFAVVLLGIFMLFVNYIIKLILQGYGELISDAKEIKEKLNNK